MKRLVETIVAVFVLIVFVSLAEAINITKAEIEGGAVEVKGNHAAKSANITWEGTLVTQSNNGGAFKFATTDLPLDCVGELSDGVNTIDVVVDGCTTEQGGGVLKTGQTTSYQAGDDGDLELGTARSYTDNGATITDNATGLVWEKLCAGMGICPKVNDKDNFYTWAEAFQKVADLNTANFGGHNDWRLPNVNELQTLADYGRFFPAIDPAFNNGTDSFTKSAFYWSSTTFANLYAPFAWFVDFFDGGVSGDGKAAGGFVRAVRGGS